MLKQVNTAVLSAALVVGIAYAAYQFTDKEEGNIDIDEVSALLESLTTESGIDFSTPEPSKFTWHLKEGEVEVEGKQMAIQEIPAADYEKVTSFFTDRNFEVDVHNVAAGTIAGAVGYQKEDMVCLVIEGITGYEDAQGQWIPPDPDKIDVNIGCGISEKVLGRDESKEETIRTLLAEKYDKKVSQVSINITEETDNHAAGSVIFQPEGPGNGGNFLAAKVDGEWEIVFDGNGSVSCERLRAYDFPQEMMNYCYEPKAISRTVKQGEEFSMILPSNPSTGYGWNTELDPQYLQLIDQEYKTAEGETVVGAGGMEVFHLKALNSGKTTLTFSYMRPWEGQAIETMTYEITIQ